MSDLHLPIKRITSHLDSLLQIANHIDLAPPLRRELQTIESNLRIYLSQIAEFADEDDSDLEKDNE